MAKKGLAQANTLRSNNISSTGYGIVYANEISGHRSVADLDALYALYDWQLSESGDNTDNDAIGQLWYVVDVDGNGNGDLYQLKDWSNRSGSDGWQKFSPGSSIDLSNYQTTAQADAKYATKTDVSTDLGTCVKYADALENTEIDNLWNSAEASE